MGGNDKDGRVEICLNNTWGSLCSDSWDFEDASVACRQLGYSSESKRSMCCFLIPDFRENGVGLEGMNAKI